MITGNISSTGKSGSWASDASQINVKNIEKLLYLNNQVINFLQDDRIFFIASHKGVGKTLLLSYKRYLKEQAKKKNENDVLLIPKNRPYLDFMMDLNNVSEEYQGLLSKLRNSIQLWDISIKISILSYVHLQLKDIDSRQINTMPERLEDWILYKRDINPSEVFSEIIYTLSPSEVLKFERKHHNLINQLVQRLHRPIDVFIDKVDQAIMDFNRSAWVSVQAGLVEAAFDLTVNNPHIKVYCSIRQEAYSSYETDQKTNYEGHLTNILYTSEDLKQMLDKLTKYNEDVPDFETFIGEDKARKFEEDEGEKIFDFIERYSLRRPRDLVLVARKFSNYTHELETTKIKSIVKRTTSDDIIPHVFNELRVFLDCLGDEHKRQEFFTLLKKNIISRKDLEEISALYNHMPIDHFNSGENITEGFYNPFCDLYVCGLLGFLYRKEDGSYVQKYKHPYDQHDYDYMRVPYSKYYFIHPGLANLISYAQNRKSTYESYQFIPVGYKQVWTETFEKLLIIQRELELLPKNKVSSKEKKMIWNFLIAIKNKLVPDHNLKDSLEWKKLTTMMETKEVLVPLHIAMEELLD